MRWNLEHLKVLKLVSFYLLSVFPGFEKSWRFHDAKLVWKMVNFLGCEIGWSRDNRVIIVRFINYDDRQFYEVNLTLRLRFATRKVARSWKFYKFLKFLRLKEEVWTNTLWYNVTVFEFLSSTPRFWAEISS